MSKRGFVPLIALGFTLCAISQASVVTYSSANWESIADAGNAVIQSINLDSFYWQQNSQSTSTGIGPEVIDYATYRSGVTAPYVQILHYDTNFNDPQFGPVPIGLTSGAYPAQLDGLISPDDTYVIAFGTPVYAFSADFFNIDNTIDDFTDGRSQVVDGFYGVVSEEPIQQIEFIGPAGGATFSMDNVLVETEPLQFAPDSVPEPSFLPIFAGLLLATGLVRRFKTGSKIKTAS